MGLGVLVVLNACTKANMSLNGKYSKGLYRVHQFSKVEMFVYTKAEDSAQMHQELLKLEKEFWQSLGVPFRVLEMCTADLGSQAVKKYDLEAWKNDVLGD
jgi:seryl-tRNA synthetase